jgi:hypothetical protein
MKTPTTEAASILGLFEPAPLRLGAALPSLPRTHSIAAMHDFLVPVLRPDLSALTEPPPDRIERSRFIDPDSMFWSPEAHGGDAA